MVHYENSLQCLIDCNENDFKYENLCYEIQCPNGKYHYENSKICIDSCNYYLYNTQICLNNCNDYYKIDDICYESCPSPYNYYDSDKNCLLNCNDENNPIQIEKYHNYNEYECLTSCSFYHIEYICYNECPSEYPFIELDNSCVVNCDNSEYYEDNKYKCLLNCPVNTFILNNVCYQNECSLINTEKKFYDIDKICIIECPEGKYHNENEYECLSNCDSNKFIYENICYNQCPNIAKYHNLNENECITDCSNQSPIKYLNEPNGNICVNSCGDDLLLTNNTCSPNCFITNELYFDIINKKCLSSCESGYSIINVNTNECLLNCDTYYVKDLINFDYTLCYIGYNNCPDDYHLQIGNTNECSNICNEEYPIIYNNNQCVTNCKDYNLYISISNPKKCVNECDNNGKKYSITNECVLDCKNTDLPYLNDGSSFCSISCDIDHPYVDSSNNICYSLCLNNQINDNIYSYNNECLSQCPDGLTYNIKKICGDSFSLIKINETFSQSPLNLEETIENLEKYLDIYLESEDNIINSENEFILQVFKANDNFDDEKLISNLNMSNCLKAICDYYQYTLNDLIIVKIDLINELNTINNVEYKIYDKNLNEINLTICSNLVSEIKYPIKNGESIKFETAKELSEKGIDIYNKNDCFFNDICCYSKIDGKSYTLEGRNEFFINVTLCENNCEYIGIDYENQKSICKCYIKSKFSYYKKSTFFDNYYYVYKNNLVKSSHNVIKDDWDILKCISRIKFKDTLFNIPFWFYLFIQIVIYISICVYFREMKKILSMMFKELKYSNPPKLKKYYNYFDGFKKNKLKNMELIIKTQNVLNEIQKQITEGNVSSISDKKENKIINNDDKNDNNPIENKENIVDNNNPIENKENRNDNNNRIESKENNNINDIENNNYYNVNEYENGINNYELNNKRFQLKFDNSFQSQLNNDNIYNKYKEENIYFGKKGYFIFKNLIKNIEKYSFRFALQKDKRSYFLMFFHNLKDKIPFTRSILKKTDFELLSLNITIFIFSFGLCFAINSFLITNNDIYNINRNYLPLFHHFWKILISTIIYRLFFKFMSKKFKSTYLIDILLSELKGHNSLKIHNNIFKKIKWKIFFNYFFLCLFTIFFWIFLTVYYIIYNSIQIIWFKWSWLSMLISLIFSLMVSILIVSLRYIGLKKRRVKIYLLSIYINSFFDYYY